MGFYDAALFLCSRDIIGFYCFKYHFFRRHWSLLIFCHSGESTKSETRTPCMLLLDSLEKANPRRLEPDIRKYVYQNLPSCVGIIVYSMFWFFFLKFPSDLYWTYIKQRVGLRLKTLFIKFLFWCLRWSLIRALD